MKKENQEKKKFSIWRVLGKTAIVLAIGVTGWGSAYFIKNPWQTPEIGRTNKMGDTTVFVESKPVIPDTGETDSLK